MSTTKKSPPLRQMSLMYDPPSARQRRKTLTKQFSEDISDIKASILDHNSEIRISLNAKTKKLPTDHPPPIKMAWTATDIKDEPVVVKKCKEIRRGKLTRHASLEKDSILNSRQDLAERFRAKKEEFEKENKAETKPNLEIFLAPSTKECEEESQNEKTQPKFLQPLIADSEYNRTFRLKKNVLKKTESPRTRPKSSTIVVVPLVEKEPDKNADNNDSKSDNNDESTGINVIIRPVTAQSRRERFHKRTNSAFHGTLKEQQPVFRPPLVRSSSAPSSRPEKSKFLATKRKMKGAKKYNKDESGTKNEVEVKEWSNAVANPGEIVTMVSLVSPGGSDNEEEAEEDVEEVVQKERPKSVLKRESSFAEKPNETDLTKNASLRKTVKSVSFQQSSIHAVRSFSASFPARRGSVACALAPSSGNSASSTKNGPAKTQEKRSTNPSSPHSDERVPKRRLLRAKTEEAKTDLWQRTSEFPRSRNSAEIQTSATFSVDIQTKTTENSNETTLEESMKLNLEENIILITTDDQKKEDLLENEKNIEDLPPDTPNEKQCWAMYCKMTEKGINVSYDTILRGLLTPTEYRMRRKTSLVEEMALLVNAPPLERAESIDQQKSIE
ncbi:uncharacterized protein LOC115877879 [Sitophilus oryzae]|uniref:Uncharacterized protein LOC115877879 n=1 Tax=Sitophilus oryzae TaxID=7048 RepID=A0A6J2XH98_SITOR|nr:uncharacterized protein LOC115877879 [Sitophilus oryzae]XP_030750088.1 uncharacterized protein LOC115877879 [Sitophilus oryzae]XP_030750089.1 uncharacterized protein LOC115877879 [Sitophilus oryzae]